MKRSGLPRLLAVGQAAVGTGFSRVAHSILSRLAERYEVHQFGLNREATLPRGAWSTYLNPTGDYRAQEQLLELARELAPDLVFVCYTLHVLPEYEAVLRELNRRCPVVVFGALDATTAPPAVVRALSAVRHVVAYTPADAAVLGGAAQMLAHADPAFTFPSMSVIPHGVDTSLFHPLRSGPGDAAWPPERERLRRAVFPQLEDARDAFVVLNANANQPRKRLDLTLLGFAAFAKGKPDNVRLCLHAPRVDAAWELDRLAAELRLERQVIITGPDNGVPGLSDTELNRLYCACDVGVNTSVAEGWGLVAFEHAATGAAQVVPRHTAFEQLWEGSAVLLPCSRPQPTPNPFLDEQLVHPGDLAQVLERLYADRAFLAEMSRAAFQKATHPEYAWENIATRWDALFRSLL